MHILTAHSDEVWFLAFSRDGSRLASGAKDGEIILWDMQVRQRLCVCVMCTCTYPRVPLRAGRLPSAAAQGAGAGRRHCTLGLEPGRLHAAELRPRGQPRGPRLLHSGQLAVHWSVSCALVGRLCTGRSALGQLCTGLSSVHWSVGCALVGRLCTGRSAVHWSVGCALVCRLCTGLSAVHWSVGCALVGRLCTGLSAVHWSVGCALVSRLCTGLSAVHWSVGCALVGRLCTGRPALRVSPLDVKG